MVDQPSVQPEVARRNLVLKSAFAAFVIASLSAVPAWTRATNHAWIDLLMQAVPPLSAAALFAGLCIGFVTLCPVPRITAVTAFTFPAMHVAITYAMAQLLSSRSNALMEPLPQQVPIQSWLNTSTWLLALGAEFCVFVVVGLGSARARHSSP